MDATQVSGLVYSLAAQKKRIYLNNNTPYNQFMFENFGTGDSSAYTWKVQSLFLYADNTMMEPDNWCILLRRVRTKIVRWLKSFSLLNKSILYMFQIQWAFHWMHFNWLGSHSYPRSHDVVDHPYSHSKASNRAGNDGRSGHDLDLYGHESDVKRV